MADSSFIIRQSSLRIVIMATGPFAVPTFRALAEPPDRFQILALFTRPERPLHGRDKHQPAASLMRAMAEERGLPIHAPESINSAEAHKVLKNLAADLIVISTHGFTGLKHVFLGSVAEQVVRRAPCPVLVVREHEHEFIVA